MSIENSAKKEIKQKIIMTELQQLSHDSFYNMQDYSQITIDLIEEVEEAFSEHYTEDFTEQEIRDTLGALSYRISTIVEVIDPELGTDAKALLKLIEIIEEQLNKI